MSGLNRASSQRNLNDLTSDVDKQGDQTDQSAPIAGRVTG